MTGGALHDVRAGGAERGLLRGGSARLTGDNRAGMPHPAARRRRSAAMKPTTGFVTCASMNAAASCSFDPADLADHHNPARVGVVLEQLEDVDEGGAHDRVAADADARRLPEPFSVSCATAS